MSAIASFFAFIFACPSASAAPQTKLPASIDIAKDMGAPPPSAHHLDPATTAHFGGESSRPATPESADGYSSDEFGAGSKPKDSDSDACDKMGL